MTRKIAAENSAWTPIEIANRAEELIAWAVERWSEE
jgi:hypothetical protein